jgi:hypothetical protein
MSNSKQITAVLTLKEVEKEKIDLQSPVRKYLRTYRKLNTVTVLFIELSAGITDIDKPLIFKARLLTMVIQLILCLGK